VRDLPPTDLIHARLDSEAVAAANLLLDQAEGVIIATPVYKAAYSGVLKTFLDLLPQDALQGKTILPIATGGSSAHLLALDYALKPVLCALGATHILRGVYVTDSQIQIEHGGLIRLDDAVELRLQASLNELIGGQTYSRSKRSAVAATPVTI
jgi:FMN reductase